MNKDIQIHAHRGLTTKYHENTFDAFKEATYKGFDGIEMDVVVTKDFKLILSHDPLILQNNKKKINLFKTPYKELKKTRFADKKNVNYSLEPLENVILKIQKIIQKNKLKPIIFNIEVKSYKKWDNIHHPEPTEYAKLINNALEKLNIKKTCFIQSFDHRILNQLYKIDKRIKLCLLVENKLPLEKNLARLTFKPYAYNPNYKLITKSLISSLKKKKIKVFTWTVNSISNVKKMIELEVNGIITDKYQENIFKHKKLSEF